MYTVVRSVRENSNEKKGGGRGKKKQEEKRERKKKKKKRTKVLLDPRITLLCTSFHIEPPVGFTHEIMRGVETR